MELEKKVLYAGPLMAVALWVMDSFLDYFVFHMGSSDSLLDVLLFEIPTHELFLRTTLTLVLIVFSIVLSRVMEKNRKTRDVLRESEERFKNIFMNSPVAISINPFSSKSHTGDEKLAINNPAAEKFFGYSEAELKSITVNELSHPDDMKTDTEYFNRLLAGEVGSYSLEKRYFKKDGKIVWGNLNITLIRDEAGNPAGVLAMLEDITGKKEAEENLLKTKKELQNVYDSITDMLTVISPNYRVLSANKTVENHFGDVVGKVCYEAYQNRDEICPDCPVKRSLVSKKPEFSFQPATEVSPNVDIFTYPIIDENGQLIGVVEHGKVVDERIEAERALKESEKRFELAVEGSNDGIWDWEDLTKDEYWWSSRVYEMLGYEPDEIEARISTWKELMHPDDSGHVLQVLQDHFDKEAPYDVEFRMKKKSGDYMWMHARGVSRRDENGKPIRMAGSVSDVTERKEAEEALTKSEEKYRTYIDNAPIGVIIADSGGRYLEVNDEVCRITGYSKEELLKMTIPDIVSEESLERASEAFRELSETGRRSEGDEIEFVKKDGSKIWVWVDAVKLSEDRFMGFHSDITDRKKAEDSLKHSEANLKKAEEIGKSGNWEWDISTGKLNWSQGTYGIYDIDLNEEPRYDLVIKTLEPDCRERFEKAIEGALKGEPFEGEYEIITLKGNHKHTHTKGKAIFDEKGSPKRMFGFVQDVTDRKKAEQSIKNREEFLGTVVNGLPALISYVDKNQVYRFANDNYKKWFGLEPKDIVGKTVEEITGKGYANIKDGIAKALSGESSEYEGQMPTKDGLKHFHSQNIPKFNEKGEVEGYFVLAEDITKRKKAEELIKSQLKEKEVLLREIHHRVKNNMNTISGLLTLQSSYVKDERDAVLFDEGKRRIKAMALVHEKLYKSEDLSQINFNDYTRSLTKSLFRSFGKGGVSLCMDDLHAGEITIDTAIPLGLIINELISNALQHGFGSGRVKKGSRVEISIKRTKAGHTLEISDNGKGFPEGADFRNTKTLGLQIVNMLTEQIGGEIELDAGKGGTTFRIKF